MEMTILSKCRSTLWLSFYILCILLVLFLPVFLQGKVIVPGDIPYTNPFWAVESAANQFTPPQNPLLSDQINQFFLWHSLVKNAIHQGRSYPLWNPYVFSGQPLVGNAQSALFYPPNLLLNRISPGVVATVRNIFNLTFAAIFTFLFTRMLGITSKGAIFSALAFMLSGPLIVWLGHPQSNVLVTFPFLLWAEERLLRRPGAGSIGVFAFGVGLSFLGGHPETTFHVLVFASIYLILRLFLDPTDLRAKARCAVAALLSGLIGVAFGAIQLFPFTDSLLHSSTLASGGRSMGGTNLFYSSEWLPNLATSVTALFPNFFGNPVSDNYQWPFFIYQNYNEQAIYFGLIPLAMLISLFFYRPRKPTVWIIVGLALFSLAVAWRIPGFELVNHLPLFSISLNKRLKMLSVLFAAVGSGFGFDAFMTSIESKKGKSAISGIQWILGLTWLIFIIVLGIKYLYHPSSGFWYHLCFNIFSLSQIKTVIPLLISLGFIILYILCTKTKIINFSLMRHGLISLSVLELTVLAWQYNPMMFEKDILPRTPVTANLNAKADQPFRLLTMNGIFWPNYPIAYGLETVDGYDLPVDRWYSDLYIAQGGSVDYRQLWQPDWPLIDYLNVRYIITSEILSLPKLRLLSEHGLFRVYENLAVMPRAFMVYNVKVISNQAKLMNAVLAHSKTLNKVVYLASLPSDFKAQNNIEITKAKVIFVSRSENEMTVFVNTNKAGLLVISDLYSKDWHAIVDGNQTEIYRANYTFRAISVPAGEHTIQFLYQPLWFTLGRTTTLGALVAIISLFTFERLRNLSKEKY